jgi:hypothetical protein
MSMPQSPDDRWSIPLYPDAEADHTAAADASRKEPSAFLRWLDNYFCRTAEDPTQD